MPRNSSLLKRNTARSNGATIHESDDRPSANALLAQLARELPAVVIHPFNDPLVIAGQGTVMIELLHQMADLDAVLAPIGGGGLLAGLCLVARTRKPELKLFACEPAGALDAAESVRQNRIIPMDYPQTIADGLRTSVGDRTLPILREGVAGFYVVDEEEIVAAMRFARNRLDLGIEPSSAVALAPLLRREEQLIGKRVGVVLTGGNVDLSTS
jgi:threonine dehydratase